MTQKISSIISVDRYRQEHHQKDRNQEIEKLVSKRGLGAALPREFYYDDMVYQWDLEHVFHRNWLFAGHVCEIPKPGDFFVFEMDEESIIVIRDERDQIHAYANVCRHRGSKICSKPCGNAKKLVCPYHQWSYRLDGTLRSARWMGDAFNRQDHSLHSFSVREMAGLIYISLAEEPPDFERAYESIQPQLVPNDIGNAQICAQFQYEIQANWKIVVENNRECYHCRVGHPEFCKSNFDVGINGDSRTDEVYQQAYQREFMEWERLGLNPREVSFPDGLWFRVARFPLKDGFQTESIDGDRVAPLMGAITEARTGSLRIVTLPNAWIHGNCDYAVTTRLSPVGPRRTMAQVTFLVDKDAKQGTDFELDRVAHVWKATSEQDWELCENTQAGVNSRYYQPGPLSEMAENSINQFIEWYFSQITGSDSVREKVRTTKDKH